MGAAAGSPQRGQAGLCSSRSPAPPVRQCCRASLRFSARLTLLSERPISKPVRAPQTSESLSPSTLNGRCSLVEIKYKSPGEKASPLHDQPRSPLPPAERRRHAFSPKSAPSPRLGTHLSHPRALGRRLSPGAHSPRGILEHITRLSDKLIFAATKDPHCRDGL